jgi:hypothetical protein
MKTKLMITALMFCSSLSLAAEPGSAPAASTAVAKKKPAKPVMAPPTTDPGTGLGSLGTGTAPSTKVVRGRGPAPTK